MPTRRKVLVGVVPGVTAMALFYALYWGVVVPRLDDASGKWLLWVTNSLLPVGALVMGARSVSVSVLTLSCLVCVILRRAFESILLSQGGAPGFYKSLALEDPLEFWTWMFAVEFAAWFSLGCAARFVRSLVRTAP